MGPKKEVKALAKFYSINVFCMPFVKEQAESLGRSWGDPDTGLYIDMNCPDDNPYDDKVVTPEAFFSYVLLHEIAHCVLGHTFNTHTLPAWYDEYEAEQMALNGASDLLRRGLITSADFEALTDLSKLYMSYHIQPYIDANLWYHVDEEIARWAGCDLTRYASREEWFVLHTWEPYEFVGPPVLSGVPFCTCYISVIEF